jgi:hypothetical protein
MAVGSAYTKVGYNLMLARMYTASPSVTAISKFGIGTGTTTPAITDTALATPITAWSGGSDYKAFYSGYPTFDTANQRATYKCFVASTEANSNTLTELGGFNTDGTPVMDLRIVHSGITKTSAVQVNHLVTVKRS